MSQLFQLFRVMGLRVKGNVSIQLMEQKDVHAPDTVALVKTEGALLVNSLKCLKVGPVDWSLEGKGHCFIKMNLSE